MKYEVGGYVIVTDRSIFNKRISVGQIGRITTICNDGALIIGFDALHQYCANPDHYVQSVPYSKEPIGLWEAIIRSLENRQEES